mmetsp:Transcript_27983/g.73802  ORF Transcript_27983/g.73802 Transcript_27983/m.73802 type:complete len:152 (-) Transcript_27983:2512-2967(-)
MLFLTMSLGDSRSKRPPEITYRPPKGDVRGVPTPGPNAPKGEVSGWPEVPKGDERGWPPRAAPPPKVDETTPHELDGDTGAASDPPNGTWACSDPEEYTRRDVGLDIPMGGGAGGGATVVTESFLPVIGSYWEASSSNSAPRSRHRPATVS